MLHWSRRIKVTVDGNEYVGNFVAVVQSRFGVCLFDLFTYHSTDSPKYSLDSKSNLMTRVLYFHLRKTVQPLSLYFFFLICIIY
jgi:hypothetical protein